MPTLSDPEIHALQQEVRALRADNRDLRSDNRELRIDNRSLRTENQALRSRGNNVSNATLETQAPQNGQLTCNEAVERVANDHLRHEMRRDAEQAISNTGAGNSMTFHIQPKSYARLGLLDAQTDLNVIIDNVMAHPDNIGFTIQVNPVKKDAGDFYRYDGVQMTSFPSTGPTKDGKIAALDHRLVTAISQKSGKECVLCGSESHNMAGHLKASKGEISGCILCNQKNHHVDTCGQFLAMTKSEQVDLVVASRVNMPALKTKLPWYEILWHYLQSDESKGENAKFPTGFPWSKSFTIDRAYEGNGRAITALQTKYDECGNKDLLPVDPSTSSIEAIFQNFWEPNGYTWPENLEQANH